MYVPHIHYSIGSDGRYQYTRDMMKLNHQGDSSGTTDSRLASALNYSAWKKQLQDHPDKDYFVCYILKGIECGFQVGVDPTANFKSATK